MKPAKGVTVVVVPFPAQGHLNQLLQISLLLTTRGVPVHFAASANHNRQAKGRLHGWDAASVQRITFHDLPLPSFSNPPPDPNAGTSFPTHLHPMLEASDHLRAPLAPLLRSLSATSRRLVVIYDPLVSFAGRDGASLPNAEVYKFSGIPAIVHLSFLYRPKGNSAGSEVLNRMLGPFDGAASEEFRAFVTRRMSDDVTDESGTLLNTYRAIEGEIIDRLAQHPASRGKKLFAIGPLNPIAVPKDSPPSHECLDWLDKQPPASVLYVSFGTNGTIPDRQIEQLAIGLQRSGQRFIWVLREPDRGDIFANGETSQQRKLLPDLEAKVEGVGIIIRSWAPQLEILAHPSTGWFLSHCGWNSCLESLSMGVPILAWPLHSDQPRNAVMVTEYLKVGVMVREWDRRFETLSSAEIEESINRLMVHNEGKEMRSRSKAFGEAARQAVSERGSSVRDLESFVAYITR